jgi:hypothetical protein
MRYQLRLVNQDLQGLTRQVALDAWNAAACLISEPLNPWLLRLLEREIHQVFDRNVRAYEYCGNASRCDSSVHPVFPRGARDPRETAPDPPPVLRYGLVSQSDGKVLLVDLLRTSLGVVVHHLPGRPLKGIARTLRRRFETTLRTRLFKSDYCGESPLCAVNERIDPWTRRAL